MVVMVELLVAAGDCKVDHTLSSLTKTKHREKVNDCYRITHKNSEVEKIPLSHCLHQREE